MSVFVIAEAGSTHDNQLDHAILLVRQAKLAGADAVKFQYWSHPTLLAIRRKRLDAEPVYKRYQMPQDWLDPLAQECHANDIEFMCTTYLPDDIAVVNPYVRRFKIASFEAMDWAFIHKHEGFKKPLIVSTGTLTEDRINDLIDYRGKAPVPVSLLHCVSEYPVPLDHLHLHKGLMGLDGFSDHSGKIPCGGWAVMLGAEIVEVHMRLSHTSTKNPDYPHSHGPRALAQYIQNIRDAEQAR